MSSNRQRTTRTQDAVTWSSDNEVNGLAQTVLEITEGEVTGIRENGTVVPLGGRDGGSGSGFELVDTLLTTAETGSHQRRNSDLRGYIKGSNANIQVDGQTAIQIVNPQTQTDGRASNSVDPSDYQWLPIPVYFSGGITR